MARNSYNTLQTNLIWTRSFLVKVEKINIWQLL